MSAPRLTSLCLERLRAEEGKLALDMGSSCDFSGPAAALGLCDGKGWVFGCPGAVNAEEWPGAWKRGDRPR